MTLLEHTTEEIKKKHKIRTLIRTEFNEFIIVVTLLVVINCNF
jgi:hypothetical protein